MADFQIRHLDPNKSNFKIRKLGPTVTVHVKITTEFRVRKWVALTLIKLAVIVLGCGLQVEDGEQING